MLAYDLSEILGINFYSVIRGVRARDFNHPDLRWNSHEGSNNLLDQNSDM